MDCVEQEKTRRGVYLNLEKSPYYVILEGNTYHFSSEKKRDMYLKRLGLTYQKIARIEAMVYRYLGDSLPLSAEVFLNELNNGAPQKTYDEMLIK